MREKNLKHEYGEWVFIEHPYHGTKPEPVMWDGKRNTEEYTLKDWLNKLYEEVTEVTSEVVEFNKSASQREVTRRDISKLAEELTDVITVCTSWLNDMGYDEEDRGKLQENVNIKNALRGYDKKHGSKHSFEEEDIEARNRRQSMGLKRRIEVLKDWACEYSGNDCGVCTYSYEDDEDFYCPFDNVMKAVKDRAMDEEIK